MTWDVVLVIIGALALVPATVAFFRGGSFLHFYVFGFLAWPVALWFAFRAGPGKTGRPRFDRMF